MPTTARDTIRYILTSTRDLLVYVLHLARPTGRHRKGSNTPRVGHHMSVQRQAAVLNALVERVNVGHMTAVDYLLAIGFPEAERYASAFGREVAKQYRKTHGGDPYKGCLVVVRGRIHQVFGYAAIEDLEAGAYSYQRTRKFLAGQRSAALHALAA